MALLLNASDSVNRSYTITKPSPTHPLDVNGTGERTGNLLQIPDAAETTQNGVTYHVKGNSLYIDGKSTAAFGINIRNAFTLKAGTYTNQMYGFTGRRIYYSFNNVNATMCTSDVNPHKTFTISEDTTYANALVWINNGVTFNNEKIDFALFESKVPKDYEPYGYKIPISSANTTTSVYLGEVETVRQIKKLVLTGEESGWAKNTVTENNAYCRAISDYYRYNGLCSHYATVDSARAETGIFFGGNINFLTKLSDEIDTVDKWKSYLQQQYANGTPVTVWYVLATEETAVVNEPLMKIGSYSDSLSTTIPCTAGENTLDVQTTVQPSEVTATFEGWHPVSAVHERESGQWD